MGPVFQLSICLAAAHVLGNFLLPRGYGGHAKPTIGAVARRAILVAGLSYLLCGAWEIWAIPVSVMIFHALIEGTMVRLPLRGAVAFLVGQSVHAATVMGIAVAASLEVPRLFGVSLFGPVYLKVLTLLTGVVLAVFGGGVLIGLAVQPLLAELGAAPNNDAAGKGGTLADGDGASPGPHSGLKHGGKYIGWLERVLTFLFVLTGQPAGIGFLITAKSIFRFGEVKEPSQRKEAEYILIGSMMSFGVGLLVAYVTKHLLAWE